MSSHKKAEITVLGMVQGVGYRPFVARLAEEHQLTGTVINSGGIVKITASGTNEAMDSFIHRLSLFKPEGARIDHIETKILPYDKEETPTDKAFKQHKFCIAKSENELESTPLIPPDLATCQKCEKELYDKDNRRYRYPFISCIACGPRYSIIEKLPYDRENITMKKYPMCPECHTEYTQKQNRRRHAQTIACHDCGPVLWLKVKNETMAECTQFERESAFEKAVELLRIGQIVAIKDIGGYHLACDPFCEESVKRLRKIKSREQKPFAVMFPDVDNIREYCEVSGQEEALLTSNPRPIVLVKKRKGEFAPSVCQKSLEVGAMVPGNPLQIMLLRELGPLVMTSANRSGEPMLIEDEEVLAWMEQPDGPDAVLWNDRPILTPLDDSVTRIVAGRTQIIRRARGYVPEPVYINRENTGTIFAAGGDLKSCFALAKGNRVYLSQHFGDMDSKQIQDAYKASLARMEKLFGLTPDKVVADMHPGYHSAQLAKSVCKENAREVDKKDRTKELKNMQVQHHHAHAASVIAEHGLTGKVLGVVFDGTGYGTDGNVWGSEFLICEEDRFERFGHLEYVTLIGGDEGAKNSKTMSVAYCLHASERPSRIAYMDISKGTLETGPEEVMKEQGEIVHMSIKTGLEEREKYIRPETKEEKNKRELVIAAIKNKINTVESSSMGRLFDAVSSLLSVCDYNDYEGQSAIELEAVARRNPSMEEEIEYPVRLLTYKRQGEWLGDVGTLFDRLQKRMRELECRYGYGEDWDKRKEELKGQLSWEFHMAICDYVLEMAKHARDEQQITQVALSGGSFQNRILMEETRKRLEEEGFYVYANEQVPPGDGGIALGQAYLGSFGE
ncbi:MAG: carbamoyltransferase HypF [Lachnospiraceae bacterium]|nr:carbamoyltransferase HypF [Lachnospiraceae bacterium]